jgi:glycosyltransferase involved in cell wall biosynthesis
MSPRSSYRIGIDFHVAGGIYQGVRTYLANLIQAILATDDESTYIVYTNEPDAFGRWRDNHPNLNLKRLPTPSGRLNLLFGFAACAFRDRLALFHSQYVLPLYLPCRSVLTIHDILFESHPEFFPKVHRRLLKSFIPLSARRASRIISVSEYTKGEIVKYYGVSDQKITVIHEGASERFGPILDQGVISKALSRYGMKRKYILFVGRIEPRKNIAGLLRAFDYVKKRGNEDISLVIVGQQDALFKETELSDTIEAMGLSRDVFFTGGVSEEDLAILYNGAEVLVYPAFAEGFGLPVLEAMACGTPVITSNTTSLPEVVGKAALTVNPYDSEGIGRALERMLSDDALKKDLSTKGLQRAKVFGWAKAAQETIQLYQGVLTTPGPGNGL